MLDLLASTSQPVEHFLVCPLVPRVGGSYQVSTIMNLRELDPLRLSRELEAVFERYRVFRRGLAHGPATVDPFLGKEFPGKRHYHFVQDLPEVDPLRPALLRWLRFLIDARIHVPWESHEAHLLHRDLHYVKEPRDGRFSLFDMTTFALDGSQGAPSAWWQQRARFEKKLSDHRAQLFLRREEVAERLGVKDAAEFFNPLERGASPTELARGVLSITQDAVQSQWEGGFAPLVEAGLSRAATEGWPARLAPDTLRDLFGAGQLFRGVNLRLGALPPRLNPASFVRAAAHLGRALSEALSARDLPFVVAREPHDLPGLLWGELFALWSTSFAFLRTRLSQSPSQARDTLRVLRGARIVHARFLAARVLARESARSPGSAEKWLEMTHVFCREELPPSSSLARFNVGVESPAHLAAHLAALRWEQELVEEYDEDWYENPRAQEELREVAREPALVRLPLARCEEGLALLRKAGRQ